MERFDLKQLKQLCELTQKEAANEEHKEDTMSWENADSQKDQAFLDLLRSMWNEEDEDNEAVDADERQDREKGAEEDNELTAGDGEVCEDKVNDKELEEIYAFAATQRKSNDESGSTYEQEEEENGEKEFTKLLEPKRPTCEHLNNTNANLVHWPDPSLDRSSSSLFSQSLGFCEGGDVLSCCSAQIPQTSEAKLCHRLSAKQLVTGRTLLQSSASIVDDISLGAPPTKSFLPVPGESPDPHRNCDPEEGFILLSADRLQEKKEPELIVLSDSNSPSPNSPLTSKNPENYTQITPHAPHPPHMEFKEPGTVESSPDCPAAMAGPSPLDCSPELSWLIPSTPLQRSKNTSSSSTQTRSSICRMQLFPKSDTLAPVFSYPDVAVKNHLHDSVSRAFTHVGSGEGDVQVSPERTLPHSSTPLHAEIHMSQICLSSSLNNCRFDKDRLKSKGIKKKLSERMESGSFHLSPLSDPLDSPSSCIHKGFRNSQRDGDHPYQSPRAAEWRKPVSPESGVTRNGTIDERENQDAFNEKPHERASLSGFHQSFLDLDEPPIAFNDSWGLDACTDANAGCFSLRLEDSGACSQQEQVHTHQSPLTPPSPGGSSCPRQAPCLQPSDTIQAQTEPGRPPPQLSTSLLDSKEWDSWKEEEDEILPLSQRANPSAQLKTPGRYSSLYIQQQQHTQLKRTWHLSFKPGCNLKKSDSRSLKMHTLKIVLMLMKTT